MRLVTVMRAVFAMPLGLIFAQPAAAAERGRPTRPVIDGEIASWFGPDAYPPEAIRAGEQGRVVVSLTLSANGTVGACKVRETSGSAALDLATCTIATSRMHFRPARDARGRAIDAAYTLPVRWVLPVSRGEAPLAVTFKRTGRQATCTVTIDGLPRHLVPQACLSLATAADDHSGATDGSGTIYTEVNDDMLLPPGR